GEDGEGAVELLGEHDAGKFVRVGHGAERKFLVSALAKRVRKTVGVATEEDEFAGAAVAQFAKPFGEGVRIENLSRSVEEHDGGGAVGVEFFNGGIGVANLSHLDGARAPDALDVVVENGAHLGAAGFAEHEEANSHDSFISSEKRSLVAMLLGMTILSD